MNFRDTFLVSCCPNSKRDKMEVHEIYQIAELISACIRGEILPAEKQQILDRWIKASEENQKLFDHFRHYRFLEQKRIAENLYDIEKAYEKFTCRRKEYIQANLPDTGRKTEKQRNIRVSGRQYVAAAIAVLLLVAGGWFAIRHIPPLLPVAEKAISPATDSARVMLIMAGGNRMDLSVLSGDTVIQQGKAKIRLNPEGGLAHESSGQTLGEVLYNQIIVPYKCEYQVMLADGTKIFLNAGSELRYPVAFTANERKVFLKGEAYFEVTRDTARPFCVETAEQNIQVLGTIFNVYAYPDEPMNYTSLMSGKVAVTDKRTGTDRVLEPGQQVVLDVVTGKAAIQEADMQQVLGWRNHDLIVKEETLEVIMAKVARWYDVKIQFAHENLKKVRFTANLHRKKDLQELLKVIATIGDLRLTYQDGIVSIDFK